MTLGVGNHLAKVELVDGKWRLVEGESQHIFVIEALPSYTQIQEDGKWLAKVTADLKEVE